MLKYELVFPIPLAGALLIKARATVAPFRNKCYLFPSVLEHVLLWLGALAHLI